MGERKGTSINVPQHRLEAGCHLNTQLLTQRFKSEQEPVLRKEKAKAAQEWG